MQVHCECLRGLPALVELPPLEAEMELLASARRVAAAAGGVEVHWVRNGTLELSRVLRVTRWIARGEDEITVRTARRRFDRDAQVGDELLVPLVPFAALDEVRDELAAFELSSLGATLASALGPATGENILSAAAEQPATMRALLEAGIDPTGVEGPRGPILGAPACRELFTELGFAPAFPWTPRWRDVDTVEAVDQVFADGIRPSAEALANEVWSHARDLEANLRLLQRAGEAGIALGDAPDGGAQALRNALERPELVQAILDAGVDPDARGRDGGAALHYADQPEIVERLVAAGADPNLPSSEPLRSYGEDGDRDNARFHPIGATPLDVAETMGRADIAEALRRHGARRGTQGNAGSLGGDRLRPWFRGRDTARAPRRHARASGHHRPDPADLRRTGPAWAVCRHRLLTSGGRDAGERARSARHQRHGRLIGYLSGVKAPAKRKSKGSDVDAFLASKRHPLEKEILSVRRMILGMDGSIREEIKWNSVSFRNDHDFFATVNLRSTATVQLILYTGVKKKATAKTGIEVDDPNGLIEKWAAKDRCLVSLGTGAEVEANAAAFTSLLEDWLRFVR